MVSPRGCGDVADPQEDNKMSRIITISCRTSKDLTNKVGAIKAVRGISYLSLLNAKDLVERINPGHSETIKVVSECLEPRYSEFVQMLKDSGFTVQESNSQNNAARRAMADEIRKLVTYSAMTAQYDIGRALLDVLETYCPQPAEPTDESEDDK